MDSSISFYLTVIEDLLKFNKKTRHGLKEPEFDEWYDARPTYFMYEFFTFNNLYAINWSGTFYTKRLQYQQGFQSTKAGPSEKKCIEFLINYVFKNKDINEIQVIEKAFIGNLTTKEVKDIVLSVKYDSCDNGNLSKIKAGEYNRIENFQLAYMHIMEDFANLEKDELIKDIINIATLVYLIRCNIFHGVKDVSELCRDWNDQEPAKMEIKKIDLYIRFLRVINYECFKTINSIAIRKGLKESGGNIEE